MLGGVTWPVAELEERFAIISNSFPYYLYLLQLTFIVILLIISIYLVYLGTSYIFNGDFNSLSTKPHSKMLSAADKKLLFTLRKELSLNRPNLEKAIDAFISSVIYYCNTLYAGVSQYSLICIQLVQNAAACLLTKKTPRREHVAIVLYKLFWLPVCFRIDFTLLRFLFKALNALPPPYLSEILTLLTLTLHKLNRALRSSNQLLLDGQTFG